MHTVRGVVRTAVTVAARASATATRRVEQGMRLTALTRVGQARQHWGWSRCVGIDAADGLGVITTASVRLCDTPESGLGILMLPCSSCPAHVAQLCRMGVGGTTRFRLCCPQPQIGCRGVVLMRLSAEAAAAVDPVAVVEAMLGDVEQGRLQRPRCVAKGKGKGRG